MTTLPPRTACGVPGPATDPLPEAVLWIVATDRRRPIFRDPVLASYTLASVDRRQGILVAVVMPASVRVLVDPALWRKADLERFQVDVERYFRRRGYRGRLWSAELPRGSRVSGGEVRRTVRRMLHRPVRSGLVEWSRNYPWAVVRRRRLAVYPPTSRHPGRRGASRAPTGASRIRG